MKKISIAAVCSLLLLYSITSCRQFNHNISISISESDHYYKFLAHYNTSNTHWVDKCMDKHLGKASNMSFVNTRIDGDIAMDDGTKFYIKKKEGYLEIKLDKTQNSFQSYNEIKALGDDLKQAMK